MQNYLKSIWNFLVKWTCNTNQKQIGTLYMLLGSFSGIIAMVLSMAIGLELAHEGGLVFKGNHTFMLFFCATIIIGICSRMIPVFLGVHSVVFPSLNSLSFWLLLWSFYLLVSSMFLQGAGTGTSHPVTANIDSHISASEAMAILSMHLAGASAAMGIINIVVTVIKASSCGTALVHVLLFLKTILVAGIFFITPSPNCVRNVRPNSIKFFPPIIVAFGISYVAGKALDATAGSIYETSKANYTLWKAQTPAERAVHSANVIARRVVEEPLSPTEGIRAEQKSSFIDVMVSSPNFLTFVGIFTFSIFLSALFVSLHRLYIARQVRLKGNEYSKQLTSSATNTADAVSIGLLTAAVSVPLARALQHFARLAALGPDADSDIFGYGSIIYELVNTDTFFSIFTIGSALIVSVVVWYLQRPV